MRTAFILFSAALMAVFAAGAEPCPAHVTHMEMRSGAYAPLPGAEFDIANFDADMVARGKTPPLCFQRTTRVSKGEVFISNESLTKLFQQKISQSANSNVSDIKVELRDDNTAKLTGKMHKKIDLPFEIDGPVSTDGTRLILKAKSIKAEKIPIKGLLGMVGDNLGKMLQSESVNGVTAKEDTLIFEPAKISHVEGHIAEVKTSAKGLTVRFAAEQAKASAHPRDRGAQ